MIKLPLWRDNLFLILLGVAALSNAVLFAFVNSRYSSLPPFLPLHYSASGEVDRLGTPVEVFLMPAIGAAVLIANFILAVLASRRERLAVHMITGTTIFVETLLLVATANIISRA